MEIADSSTVISQLWFHHRRLAALCDLLEKLADGLPALADKQQCLTIARTIFPTVLEVHKFEEEILFPLLEDPSIVDEGLAHSLERLRFEHWEDESFAEELSESLREYGSGLAPDSGDKLAYMLRGFFEGLRRHMAFETEHLVPIIENRFEKASPRSVH